MKVMEIAWVCVEIDYRKGFGPYIYLFRGPEAREKAREKARNSHYTPELFWFCWDEGISELVVSSAETWRAEWDK